MNLRRLIHTPPPPHVFGVDADRLVYARLSRDRDLVERVERVALTPGWFQLGPVGVLHVERTMLGSALSSVFSRVQRPPSRASLVVPDSWVRTLVVDLESVPRQRAEAEEVVRWRLKRILPCRPDEVRLDFLPVGNNGRLLVSLALDKPLSAVEDGFAAAGIELGRIEPAALALTPLLPATPNSLLLTVVQERAFTFLLVRGGRVVLLRHKSIPSDLGQAAEFTLRELGRTVDHARERESVSGPLEVWLVSDEAFAEAAQQWAGDSSLLLLRRLRVDRGRFPASWTDDQSALWPLLGCAWLGEA